MYRRCRKERLFPVVQDPTSCQPRYGLPCRLLLASLFVLTISWASGCQVGRSWFHMDSNSGIPFFGVDLLPSRKTSQNVDGHQPDGRLVMGEAPGEVRSANGRRVQPVKLSPLPRLRGEEDESVVEVQGPPAEFAR